jgi:hypothetical protein
MNISIIFVGFKLFKSEQPAIAQAALAHLVEHSPSNHYTKGLNLMPGQYQDQILLGFLMKIYILSL